MLIGGARLPLGAGPAEQGQWNLLKLEPRCKVIKRLFSTAMAGQDNVLAQEAFLERNGCNAGRYFTCDVANKFELF